VYFEPSLHPWDEANLVMMNDLSDMLLDLVCHYFIEDFCKHRSAIPLLGIYLKECDSSYYKSTCTPMFIAALFTIAKLWKQPRCPTTNKWFKKMWHLYTMEFYSATKKNGILSFTSKWMELIDPKQMQ
jgi:hypothetical protein